MDKIQKINRDFYNKNARSWASLKTNSFHHERPFRLFVSYLKPGPTVIDIGCANGIHVPLFLGIGRRLKYEGIDISSQFLNIARAHYPQLSFQLADIVDRRTLPRKKYDGFWAAAVLQHIPKSQWDATLSNIERLTGRNGMGYVTVPDKRPNPASQKDRRHFSLFSKPDFRRMIGSRGWKIVNSGTLPSFHKIARWHWFIVRLP